ncbi:MAG: signal peptidase I [Chloroflexi bacterium]|nr:signal peptidase I [Chloroflexota bacterium]
MFPWRRAVREVLETILLALLVFFGLQASIQNFRVLGSSMEPTLHNGQQLLVSKVVYLKIPIGMVSRVVPFLGVDQNRVVYPLHPPRQGDVIVFHFPREPKRDFIKRVIAGPGQVVEIRRGQVFINGAALDEPYLTRRSDDSMEPMVVPPSQYFVLGDNRPTSNDSRDWGPVPSELIVGKAWVVYWPLARPSLLLLAPHAP